MINITILGLDQYTIAFYAKENTKNIAKIYESNDDLINFIAPENYIYHFGVEQNSWNALVRVSAPCKFKPFEKTVAEYLLKTLKGVSINISIEFYYYETENHYEYINKEYPRFLTKSNIVDIENEEEEPEENDLNDEDEKDEERDIYLGDVFAGKLPPDDEQ